MQTDDQQCIELVGHGQHLGASQAYIVPADTVHRGSVLVSRERRALRLILHAFAYPASHDNPPALASGKQAGFAFFNDTILQVDLKEINSTSGCQSNTACVQPTIRTTIMRHPFLVFIAVCFAQVLCAQSLMPKASSHRSDGLQILALLDSMQITWNTHDMHAFANLFHPDAILVLFNAEVLQGRDSIKAGHVQVHKTILRNSVRKKRIDEFRFAAPNVAVVRTYDNLTGDERYPDKMTESRMLLVITKRKNSWRVAWGQTTRYPEFATKK